jgi:hypothetical protein
VSSSSSTSSPQDFPLVLKVGCDSIGYVGTVGRMSPVEVEFAFGYFKFAHNFFFCVVPYSFTCDVQGLSFEKRWWKSCRTNSL